MIPVHSMAVFIFPSGAKKNGVLSIILPLICLLFYLSLENRQYLMTCECSCILCPNVENFCPNNGQFFSVGDATASLYSHAIHLCLRLRHRSCQAWCYLLEHWFSNTVLKAACSSQASFVRHLAIF